ncbi:MAG: FAD binding domain-containing protein [Streptosporangiales bacterium]
MKPPAVGYLAATDVDHAVGLLAEHGDEGKVLAGGQSLLPLLNMRLGQPSVLIDVSKLAELRATGAAPTGGTRYGAGVVHAAFEDGRVDDPTGGLLREVAAGIGYRAIRNRGTIGGSLAHADASAEWPVVMAALDATVVARSARGERELSARTFVEGFFTSALEDDELVTAVDVPAPSPRTRWGFYKAARKVGEFSESFAVALVRAGDDARVAAADVWLGAAGGSPLRMETAESYVVGKERSDLAHDDVLESVAGALDPPATGAERYRAHLHGVTVWRALQQAIAKEDASWTR